MPPTGGCSWSRTRAAIWTYDNISDTSATLVLDYSARINTFLDRGLSGLALDPNYPATPHLYLLYTHDTATNAENGHVDREPQRERQLSHASRAVQSRLRQLRACFRAWWTPAATR